MRKLLSCVCQCIIPVSAWREREDVEDVAESCSRFLVGAKDSTLRLSGVVQVCISHTGITTKLHSVYCLVIAYMSNEVSAARLHSAHLRGSILYIS